MRLKRNEGPVGKYAVINLEKLPEGSIISIKGPNGEDLSEHINFGFNGSESEFFVLMLKDTNAKAALLTYAYVCQTQDPEYAADIRELANRAGTNSPFCKTPD